jgi:hypothetical protein
MKREERLAIWERDGRRCGICGEPVPLELLEVDHILGTARGGSSDQENLRASHRRCNRRKAILEDRPTRGRPRLYIVRQMLQAKLEPLALKRLDALAEKLTMNRTGVLHLAIARLAELERVEVARDEA